jgi:hypothetical protein
MSSVNIGVVFIRWHTRRWVYSSKREGNKTNPLTFSDVDMTIDLEIDSKHVESYLTIHTNGVYTCDGYVIDSHWLQTSVYANSHTVHSESTFEQANRLDIGPSHRRKCFVLQTIRWVQFVFLLTPLINKKETYFVLSILVEYWIWMIHSRQNEYPSLYLRKLSSNSFFLLFTHDDEQQCSYTNALLSMLRRQRNLSIVSLIDEYDNDIIFTFVHV